MTLDNIGSASQALSDVARRTGDTAKTSAVGDTFGRILEAVEETAGKANNAVGEMVQGTGDVHEAMIALQRADLTLQLTVQVRNKLVQAYQEIMRMPV